MDQVAQQNTANAKESAATSEELNSQAEQMTDFVRDLMSLAGERRQHDFHQAQAPSVDRHGFVITGAHQDQKESGRAILRRLTQGN